MSILSRFKKVNWIADVLTPSAVILMEVLWLYPWLVFIGKELGARYSEDTSEFTVANLRPRVFLPRD